MTLDQRIEAAARAHNPPAFEDVDDDAYAYQASDREDAMAEAEAMLMAAFPELFTEPPTMWLAPWEATKVMNKAADHEIWCQQGEVSQQDSIDLCFAAMRDAHLQSQEGKG